MRLARAALALFTGLAIVAFAGPVGSSDSAALWHFVHDLCLTDMKVTGHPAPCLAVDRKAGWAVLRAPGERTHLLVTPTRRIAGIESPALLAPGSPNYWQAAWAARRWIERRTGRSIPREDIGLAINSIYGRSQDLLHIHVDCVRPDVVAALKSGWWGVGWDWAPIPYHLAHRTYRVRRLTGAELGDRDPFKLLAAENAYVRSHMASQTLVVLGATFPDGSPGFVLAAAEGGRAGNAEGHGEELLDHTCQILKPVADQAPMP
jgi:CDP-diacylglycerol pyrophosphatase